MATGLLLSLLVWDFSDGRGMSLSFGMTVVVGDSVRFVVRMWKEQEWPSIFRWRDGFEGLWDVSKSGQTGASPTNLAKCGGSLIFLGVHR